MSVWLPYLKLLPSLDHQLTDADLAAGDDWDVIAYEDEVERGQVTRASIEIVNPGASLYSPTAPRYLIVLESADGTVANSRTVMKGTIQPQIRSDAERNQFTIKVTVIGAPPDVKNLIFNRALSTDMVQPQWEPLAEDLSFDAPENCLVGWGAFYNVDEATHAITREDFIDSDLPVVYVDDQTDVASQKLSDGPPPVARAVLRVSCEFEQYCLALVDASGRIAEVTTMNGDHFEGMQERTDASKYLNVNLGGGWSVEKTSASGVQFKSNQVYTGRRYAANYAQGAPYTQQYTDANGNTSGKQIGSLSFGSMPVDEMASFWVTSYRWDYYWLKCEYRQPRRELLTFYMDMPLQQVAGVQAREDLGTINLKDLLTWEYANPTPPPPPDANGDYRFPYSATMQAKPHDNFTIHEAGDIVTYGGYGFQCTKDGTSGYLYTWPIPADKLVVVNSRASLSYLLTPQLSSGWKRIPWGGAIADTRTPTFLDTQRGLQVQQHVLLRMRAFLRSRLQSQILKFGTDWETGWGIGCRHLVRVRYYDPGQRTGRFMHGKVRARKRRIDQKGKWVELTLGLCTGTGQADTLEQAGPTKAVAATISPDQWFATIAAQDQAVNSITSILEFKTGYPLDKLGTFAVSDVAWTYGAEPAFVPVDAYRLGQAAYSVVSVVKSNMADVQFARAAQYGFGLVDPRNAARDYPTRVDVVMRDVQSGGTLERQYHGVAQLVRSPKGIDMFGGDA